MKKFIATVTIIAVLLALFTASAFATTLEHGIDVDFNYPYGGLGFL